MIQTYNQITRDLSEGKFSKIYLLMGEETFFIKKISQFFETNFIEEQYRSFNLETLYGIDTSIENVVGSSKSFPMMSDKKLIIVKEAQDLDIFKRSNEKKSQVLIDYLNNINNSTTLIFCLNNKMLDKRGKLYKTINEYACVLDSSSKENKIYDNNLPSWINSQVKKNNYSISEDAVFLLIENIGNNLEKIDNGLSKVYSNINGDSISKEDILTCVGINREYNFFEFQDSLVDRSALKCSRILNFFISNQKKYPIQQVIIYLYSFFSKLLVVKSQKLNNSDNISSAISVHPYVAKSYLKAMNNYNLTELYLIIGFIRELDLISKGLKQIKADNRSLFSELIFKIFNK